eukprot:TRINITY_DN14402_c0_g1_i2.p1 TRINITY_DN14402_c0_g1~~TRINITY_DN14402_c0_g1_i2.p1  ORF type:complete len:318 (-),score=45.13 TRINITY_DN14402_c0_g1_i2:42-995(-)
MSRLFKCLHECWSSRRVEQVFIFVSVAEPCLALAAMVLLLGATMQCGDHPIQNLLWICVVNMLVSWVSFGVAPCSGIERQHEELRWSTTIVGVRFFSSLVFCLTAALSQVTWLSCRLNSFTIFYVQLAFLVETALLLIFGCCLVIHRAQRNERIRRRQFSASVQPLARSARPFRRVQPNELDARTQDVTNQQVSKAETSPLELLVLGRERTHVFAKMGPCVVCLEEVGVNDDMAQLPCGHTFHTSCIESWLSRGNGCPLRCKTKMFNVLAEEQQFPPVDEHVAPAGIDALTLLGASTLSASHSPSIGDTRGWQMQAV